MGNETYEDLLSYILDESNKLPCEGSQLTIERFVSTVLKCILDGEVPKGCSREEFDKLETLIGKTFRCPDKACMELMDYVIGRTAVELTEDGKTMDVLYRAVAVKHLYDYNGIVYELMELVLLNPSKKLTETIKEDSEFVPSGNDRPQTKPFDPSSGDDEPKTPGKIEELFRHFTGGSGDTDGKSSDDDPDGGAVTGAEAVEKLVNEARDIHSKLLERIFGQENAVNVFVSGYFQAGILAMTDKKRTRPRAIYLFAGPPGVGKTFMAETAANILGRPFRRFDMSEYSDDESNIEFCGSDKVYKNGKAGNVTSFVEANPHCVILFDEIEKAHLNVIHLFLQMLDAGRLRDNFTDTEVSFTDAIIIMTTNAGKQLYEADENGNYSGVSRKIILKALEKDVNPTTQKPFFPAAICSRFASGNVVMFNHMTAFDLCNIARKELTRHAENFSRTFNVDVEFDEKVFATILFAEGGKADARTVRSRAESFFNDELFELFRLIASDKTDCRLTDLKKIRFSLDLPDNDPFVTGLYSKAHDFTSVFFADEDTVAYCAEKSPDCRFLRAKEPSDADKIIASNDVGAVLIDMKCGIKDGTEKFLNAEDIDCPARDFLWHIRSKYAGMPVYLVTYPGMEFNEEETLSFLRLGIRGFIQLRGEDADFTGTMRDLGEQIHQQQVMSELSKANKIITYETAQLVSPDGSEAEVRLFDFEKTTAVESDDADSIVSDLSKPNVRFDDVIGADDAKRELTYFVDYLKNPKKYLGSGVKAPRGILLYGPPGTGKTMLAKAMAGESDVTFINTTGTQFQKKYVGEGPEAVHELFRKARKYAPAIIFIDEIDAIAKERGQNNGSVSMDAVVNAFLTEMDGFINDTTKPVFVLAATNFDVTPGGSRSLDPALMRRFDRRVFIDLPNKENRKAYLTKMAEKYPALKLSREEIDNIALRSTGMSLAELDSVVELALRSAIRDGSMAVTDAVFDEAFETFGYGEIKKWDPSELRMTARHEVGHALLSYLSGRRKPTYLTIVARGKHGGYMLSSGDEKKGSYNVNELREIIRTSLGGRAAEIVYYGNVDGMTTGPSSDLSHATSLATDMVCRYGMDKDFGSAVIDPATAPGEICVRIRHAVNAILTEELDRAIGLITEHRTAVDALVDALMEKDHMNGDEIEYVLKKYI